jgi:hypothetical protein
MSQTPFASGADNIVAVSGRLRAPNWTADEVEQIVDWLGYEQNYERSKNQGREMWVSDMAAQIPTRTIAQVSSLHIFLIKFFSFQGVFIQNGSLV